jgi:hypothetical protein
MQAQDALRLPHQEATVGVVRSLQDSRNTPVQNTV